MTMVEATIPVEHVEEVTSELRAKLPNVFIGTKVLGDGLVSMVVTAYAETPELLELVQSVIESDVAKFDRKPTAAPSLSDLVARAKAASEAE